MAENSNKTKANSAKNGKIKKIPKEITKESSKESSKETSVVPIVQPLQSAENKVEDISNVQHHLAGKPNEIEARQNEIQLYENLVLSGGSVRGLCHIGAIKKLTEVKMLDLKKLKAVAGTSAGAIVCLFIVLGYSLEEMWDYIMEIDVAKLVSLDFAMFAKKFGVDSGQKFYNIIDEIIQKKTNNRHINFKDLYDKTGIHFTVVGSCLTTKSEVHFDHVSHPTFRVSTAVRISISMPGIFAPIEVEGKSYVDGGMLNNYPMNAIPKDQLNKTIGILISNEYNTSFNSVEEYLMANMNLLMYKYFVEAYKKYENYTIQIQTIPGISMVSFDIGKDKKQMLFDHGYQAVSDFLKKNENKNNAAVKN
jgi:predicted acylesterase/phospholipase RssA